MHAPQRCAGIALLLAETANLEPLLPAAKSFLLLKSKHLKLLRLTRRKSRDPAFAELNRFVVTGIDVESKEWLENIVVLPLIIHQMHHITGKAFVNFQLALPIR